MTREGTQRAFAAVVVAASPLALAALVLVAWAVSWAAFALGPVALLPTAAAFGMLSTLVVAVPVLVIAAVVLAVRAIVHEGSAGIRTTVVAIVLAAVDGVLYGIAFPALVAFSPLATLLRPMEA